jgi:hypothetical protein
MSLFVEQDVFFKLFPKERSMRRIRKIVLVFLALLGVAALAFAGGAGEAAGGVKGKITIGYTG